MCANLRISETPRRSATLRLVAEGTGGPLFVVFDNMVRVLMVGDLRAKKYNISPAFGQVFSHFCLDHSACTIMTPDPGQVWDNDIATSPGPGPGQSHRIAIDIRRIEQLVVLSAGYS